MKKIFALLLVSLFVVSCGTKDNKTLEESSSTNTNTGVVSSDSSTGTGKSEVVSSKLDKDLVVTLYTDTSYFTGAKDLQNFVNLFKVENPNLSNIKYEIIDYQKDQKKVEDFMKKVNKVTLPLVNFSSLELGEATTKLKPFISTIEGKHLLNLGDVYNPVTKKVLDPNVTEGQLVNKDQIQLVKDIKKSYFHKGSKDDLLFMMFEDFECPYCKLAHTNKSHEFIIKEVLPKYDASLVFVNLPLTDLHVNAKYKALEYLKEIEKGGDPVKEAEKLFDRNDSVEIKFDEKDYSEKVKTQLENEKKLSVAFRILGTPTLVIYNTKTNKYITTPLAYSPEQILEQIKQNGLEPQ